MLPKEREKQLYKNILNNIINNRMKNINKLNCKRICNQITEKEYNISLLNIQLEYETEIEKLVLNLINKL